MFCSKDKTLNLRQSLNARSLLAAPLKLLNTSGIIIIPELSCYYIDSDSKVLKKYMERENFKNDEGRIC